MSVPGKAGSIGTPLRVAIDVGCCEFCPGVGTELPQLIDNQALRVDTGARHHQKKRADCLYRSRPCDLAMHNAPFSCGVMYHLPEQDYIENPLQERLLTAFESMLGHFHKYYDVLRVAMCRRSMAERLCKVLLLRSTLFVKMP